MKINKGLFVAVAIAAGCVAGLAQTNTSGSPPAAETPATTAPAPAAEAPAPAAPAAETPAAPAAATAPVTVAAPAATAAEASSTNAPGAEVMPLIVITEAPLPDAIQNLARTANLNILFDPRVMEGKVDPNKPQAAPAQPMVNFRMENVTAIQALHALLDNYQLQLVQGDPKSKIYRVTLKEPNAPEPLIPKIISLRYTHPTNMIPFVKASFSSPTHSQVIADPRTSQLLVLATEKELAAIDEVVARLDTAPSQILIEARFMEATQNPKSAKGVDWSGTLAAHNLSFGNRSFYEKNLEPKPPTLSDPGFAGKISGVLDDPKIIMSTVGGFNGIGFLNSDGLNAVVSFLNTDSQTETIATPRAVTLEGVPTELSVVQNVPVFEEEQGQPTASGPGNVSVKPNYNLVVNGNLLTEVGTKLMVTPRVYAETNVFLDLKPEISDVGPTATTTLGGKVSTAPTFVRKRIQTQALLPSGYTLVLGGLREDRNNKTLTKVPLLGDIPGVGRAFRSDTKERNKRQLLIFVTPTIVAADDYLPAAEARDFLNQKPVDKPVTPWPPYDNAEPHDWTKPVD